MESIFDCIYSVNRFAEAFNTGTLKVQNTFSLLNDALYKSIQIIEDFERVLYDLNAHISFTVSKQIPEHTLADPYLQDKTGQANQTEVNHGYDNLNPVENEVYDIKEPEVIKKSAEVFGKILARFGELPPALEKLKTGLVIAGDLTGGVIGAEQLLSAGTKISVIDGVLAGFDVMAAIEAVAGATAVLNPLGWITLAGITATEVVYDETKREDQQRKHHIAEDKITQRSLKTFEMTGSKAIDFIKNVDALSKIEEHPWRLNYFPAKENAKLYGTNAYSLEHTFPSVISKVDNVNFRPNVPPALLHKQEDRSPVQKSYLEQTSSLQLYLESVAFSRGIEEFQTEALKAVSKAKLYDKTNGTQNVKMVLSAIKETSAFVLNKANDERSVPEFNLKNSVKPNENRASGYSPGNNKVININLNKSLIGNFTVNTRNVKEGLNSLKHEVEEVLLEILNSANVIQ